MFTEMINNDNNNQNKDHIIIRIKFIIGNIIKLITIRKYYKNDKINSNYNKYKNYKNTIVLVRPTLKDKVKSSLF